jgi:hypothetical protein
MAQALYAHMNNKRKMKKEKKRKEKKHFKVIFLLWFLFTFLVALEFELRASCLRVTKQVLLLLEPLGQP